MSRKHSLALHYLPRNQQPVLSPLARDPRFKADASAASRTSEAIIATRHHQLMPDAMKASCAARGNLRGSKLPGEADYLIRAEANELARDAGKVAAETSRFRRSRKVSTTAASFLKAAQELRRATSPSIIDRRPSLISLGNLAMPAARIRRSTVIRYKPPAFDYVSAGG